MLVDRFIYSLSGARAELSIIYKICKAWHELVPEQFLQVTCPLKLVIEKTPFIRPNVQDKKTVSYVLFIGAHNNAVGSQFYYLKNEIISKICTYFGRNIVTDIKITLRHFSNLPGHKSAVPTESGAEVKSPAILDQITDEELKGNLLLLYSTVNK